MSNNIFKSKRRKCAHRYERGGIVAEFYIDEKGKDPKGNFLRIFSPGTAWEHRVIGYPYGYLLTSALQGDIDEVFSFAMLMWRVEQGVYQDEEFAMAMLDAVKEHDRQLELQAELEAAAVTAEQEQANQLVMEDVAEYADALSNEDREIIREGWKREIESEINNGTENERE